MTNPHWKRTGRRIATLLGGRRVPVTGRQRGDAPDIEHPAYSIEVKHRATLPGWLLTAMYQARAAASAGRLPIVVIHEHGAAYADALVVMRLADFIEGTQCQ